MRQPSPCAIAKCVNRLLNCAIAKCVNRLLNCAIAKCVNRLLNCAIAKCVIRLLVRQPSVSSVSMCDSYSETPPIAKCLNRIENPQRTLNLLYHSLNALFSLSLSLLQSIPSCHSLFVAYSALLSMYIEGLIAHKLCLAIVFCLTKWAIPETSP